MHSQNIVPVNKKCTKIKFEIKSTVPIFSLMIEWGAALHRNHSLMISKPWTVHLPFSLQGLFKTPVTSVLWI